LPRPPPQPRLATVALNLGAQLVKDGLQQLRLDHVLGFGKTAQAHRSLTDLLLHPG